MITVISLGEEKPLKLHFVIELNFWILSQSKSVKCLHFNQIFFFHHREIFSVGNLPHEIIAEVVSCFINSNLEKSHQKNVFKKHKMLIFFC